MLDPIYFASQESGIVAIPLKNQYGGLITSAIPQNIIARVEGQENILNAGGGKFSEEVSIVFYEGSTFVGNDTEKNNSIYNVSELQSVVDGTNTFYFCYIYT